MEPKTLQNITSEYLAINLPQVCLDKISHAYISQMNVPWLRMVGRLFDSCSEYNNSMQKKPTELINKFTEKFPYSVRVAKQQKKKQGVKDFGKYYDAIYYFKKDDIYYVIETISNNDIHVNNDMITFFRNEGLDPSIAISFE